VAGLYVHVPFRHARRSYGDSNDVVFDAAALEQYEAALCRELRSYVQPHTTDEPITTLYVGGGRPSLVPVSMARPFLAVLREGIDVSTLEETTVEVHPADAKPRLLRTLWRLGVDRLSLAVHSFSPAVLRTLDAPHSAEEARRVLDATRQAGFTTYSIDLLFGIPNQSLSTWTSTLQYAVERDVPHITIIEASPHADAPAALRADQLEHAMMLLDAEEYEQYELTHFARPGHRSAHQENYYAHGNYLGVGPSAESFWWLDRTGTNRARRWTNVGDFDRYANLLRRRHPPVAYRQTLPQRALADEYILLRLRTNDGLDLRRLNKEYGLNLRAQKAPLLDRLRDDNLIHNDPDRVRLTPQGRLLTDAITKRLLPS